MFQFLNSHLTARQGLMKNLVSTGFFNHSQYYTFDKRCILAVLYFSQPRIPVDCRKRINIRTGTT